MARAQVSNEMTGKVYVGGRLTGGIEAFDSIHEKLRVSRVSANLPVANKFNQTVRKIIGELKDRRLNCVTDFDGKKPVTLAKNREQAF